MDNNTDTHTISLSMRLMQYGAPPDEAKVIDQAFRDENIEDFIDGMESIAFCIATATPLTTQEIPKSAPWQGIWIDMVNTIESGKTSQLAEAFSIAMRPFYDNALLQMAITNLVGVRMGVAEDFEKEKGSRKRVKTKEYIKALKGSAGFRLNACNDKIEVTTTF